MTALLLVCTIQSSFTFLGDGVVKVENASICRTDCCFTLTLKPVLSQTDSDPCSLGALGLREPFAKGRVLSAACQHAVVRDGWVKAPLVAPRLAGHRSGSL